MSYYLEAFKVTLGHEGGYGNDPVDVGGETYKGISRRFNPNWDGWKIIDLAKIEDIHFPSSLETYEGLQKSVQDYYRMRYWDEYLGDDMPMALALEMFDTAVNMGVGRAVKFLQIALNCLNRNGSLYPDMVEDGSYGPTTHRNLYQYLSMDSVFLLVKMINVQQGMHYINYMKKSPKQEKYARGWFKRVTT